MAKPLILNRRVAHARMGTAKSNENGYRQIPPARSRRSNEAKNSKSCSQPAQRTESKRQGTAALQDAVATNCTLLRPRGLGVRLSPAAFSVDARATALLRSLASCCSELESRFSCDRGASGRG